MRISDWSSDVCSSDLRQIEGRGSPINLLRRGCAKRQEKSQQRNGYDGRAASAGKPHHHAQNQSSGTITVSPGLTGVFGVASPFMILSPSFRSIEAALLGWCSCRVSGCQYGDNSGAAVTLKKKKTK